MLGDVVGKPGRNLVKKYIPLFKQNGLANFVTINGENLAGGFGITSKIYDEMMSVGVDVITMGNHWKDKQDIHQLRRANTNIVLPQNLMGVSDVDKVPSFYISDSKIHINIINLMGVFAMKDSYYNPLQYLIREKENFIEKKNSGNHIIIADIHAESSGEKQAIAWLYDGLLSGLIGTHTHVPTSDERITANGTAFLTDVGMTGAYDSVIGMKKERVILKLSNTGNPGPHEVAEKDCWLCAFLIEINLKNCQTVSCHRIQCRSSDFTSEQWLVSSVK